MAYTSHGSGYYTLKTVTGYMVQPHSRWGDAFSSAPGSLKSIVEDSPIGAGENRSSQSWEEQRGKK